MLFRSILCPVDLSEVSAAAAEYAAALAAQAGGELTLLHVLPAPDAGYSLVEPSEDRLRQLAGAQHDAASQALDRLLPNPVSCRVSRDIATGDPASVIAGAASSGNYSLVVMPTQGAGALRRWLLVGSVTAKVLNSVECPVLSATGFHTSGDPRRILCAVDLGPETERVLDAAAALAHSSNASLSVLHALPKLGESLWDEADSAWRDTLQLRARRIISSMLPPHQPPAEVLVETDSPAVSVARAAARIEADLVVIGRGAPGELGRRLRANAYEIIRSSPCPVLSI